MLLAHESAEPLRERARASWLSRAYPAVARHHHPTLNVERSHISFVHRAAHYARAAVVNDLLIGFNRRAVCRRGDLFKVLEFKLRVRSAVGNKHVARASNVLKGLLNFLLVVVM